MNNDQYNNQNNPTDNAPIASPEVKDVKATMGFYGGSDDETSSG